MKHIKQTPLNTIVGSKSHCMVRHRDEYILLTGYPLRMLLLLLWRRSILPISTYKFNNLRNIDFYCKID